MRLALLNLRRLIPSSGSSFRRLCRRLIASGAPQSDLTALVNEIEAKLPKDRSSHVGLFLGTSQYNATPKVTAETPDSNRLVVLCLGDAWTPFRDTPPREILDVTTSCTLNEVAKAVRAAGLSQKILTGEVDCLGKRAWSHGYSVEDFSIFSRVEPVLWTKVFFTGPAFCVASGSRFHVDDVISVQVKMSDEPWEERSLQLEVKNKEKKELVSILEMVSSLEEVTGDAMADLVFSTEWIVKAGAQLCIASSRLSSLGHRPQLKLPRVLLEDSNVYVRLRNDAWARRVAQFSRDE
eukprot:m.306176 g.306176  ORF g.306176 m.306176 type:complete len:294 (+) comp41023_c0_seq1:2336-3217(+)